MENNIMICMIHAAYLSVHTRPAGSPCESSVQLALTLESGSIRRWNLEVPALSDAHDRREFLGLAGAVGAAVAAGVLAPYDAEASTKKGETEKYAWMYGCLVDTTQCVGCRSCEEACNIANELPKPDKSFDDPTVLNEMRRPSPGAFTVVNRYYPNPPNGHNE